MHPLKLCYTLTVYVQVRVTRGAPIAHRYAYAPPRCRTSQYCRTFVLLSVSLWNDLADPAFDGVGLAGLESRANASYWPNLLSTYKSSIFPFLFFLSIGWYCGAGVFVVIECISFSLSLALPAYFNNNNNDNKVYRYHSRTYRYHASFILTTVAGINAGVVIVAGGRVGDQLAVRQARAIGAACSHGAVHLWV